MNPSLEAATHVSILDHRGAGMTSVVDAAVAWQGVLVFVAVAIISTVVFAIYLRHRRALVVARLASDRDGAYRELAATTTAEVARLASEIAALRTSVAEVQRVLREVG